LVPGGVERLDHTAFHVAALGIVVVRDLVHLPEIEMVRLQPAKRVVELAHRDVCTPAVRAHFGHEENLIAPAGERLAHTLFALSVVVLPRVVHERDARVDGGVNQAGAFALRPDESEMPSPQSDRRDSFAGRAERAARDWFVDGPGLARGRMRRSGSLGPRCHA
jgi:hypothetical protein